MTGKTRIAVTKAAERGIRVAILAVFVTGVRRRSPAAVVNSALALTATCLPDAVERRSDIEFRPWQRVYVELAMLTHAVGMIGPYDDVGWWDHVTHTHSATLVGGLVHALARRRDRDPRPRVLASVVAFGTLWELLEYTVHVASRRVDLEPLLVSYGASDTALDLVFNLVGALLVLAFGDRLLGNFIRRDE